MREQLKQMGISYDWDREIATCSPDYYRWEQLFFLWMLKDGIAYRKRATLNWCDECQTVLANEQVNRDGTCFIHDHTPVKQKELDQWFFAITRYAEELLEGHKELAAGWPENILEMQRNWIGRSEGAEITFPLADGDGEITVFTTRPDTLFGATFMSMAPEHPMAMEFARKSGREKEVREFVERVARPGPGSADGRGAGQGRRLHRGILHQPRHRRPHPRLRRQLRPVRIRHRRGHGGPRARPAGLRVREEVRPPDRRRRPAGRGGARRRLDAGRARGAGEAGPLGGIRRDRQRGGEEGRHPAPRRDGAGARPRCSTASATGA